MNLKEAKTLGEQLAYAANGNSETRWAYWAALFAFPSPPIVDPWQEPDNAVLRWLDGSALLIAEGKDEGIVDFACRPILSNGASFTARFQSAELHDPAGLGNVTGLRTNWKFALPDGEPLDISGEVRVGRAANAVEEYADKDEAEIFAQSIATRMMGTA
jgi:hypothetical protein